MKEVTRTKTQAVDHTVIVYRLTIMDGIKLGLGLTLASFLANTLENLFYSLMSVM